MRISDWSSDVCSSDLHSQPSKNSEWRCGRGLRLWPRLPTGSTPYIGGNTVVGRLLAKSKMRHQAAERPWPAADRNRQRSVEREGPPPFPRAVRRLGNALDKIDQIGKASGRERVCRYG